LKKEKRQEFEQTDTYQLIKAKYEQKTGSDAPYAIMPKVVISGPKLSRDYNTNWFAERVNGRYQNCMSKAKRIKLEE
jgi:5-methylcytosine-specific restriction endonuclease McrBC regulatory subunit McrC